MNHEAKARVPADVFAWYQEAAEKAGYDDLAKWVRAVLTEAAQRIAPRD